MLEQMSEHEIEQVSGGMPIAYKNWLYANMRVLARGGLDVSDLERAM
jgi:hypothetical protein